MHCFRENHLISGRFPEKGFLLGEGFNIDFLAKLYWWNNIFDVIAQKQIYHLYAFTHEE